MKNVFGTFCPYLLIPFLMHTATASASSNTSDAIIPTTKKAIIDTVKVYSSETKAIEYEADIIGEHFVKNNSTKASPSKSAIFLQNPGKDTRITNRKFEQVPAVVASADGKQIYVAWYSGGEAPGPGNYVTVAVSLDYGKSWLNDQLVVYPSAPTNRIFDPGLWRDKSGQIWLFYGSAQNNKLWDSKGGVNAVKISWDGSKINYQDPKLLSYGVISNKPIYLPKEDQVFFPIYIDKANPEDVGKKDIPKDGAFILTHSYKQPGSEIDTLQIYSSVKVPEAIRIHDEPQVVQLSDTDFLCLVRTTKGIYYAKSADRGKTWSAIAPFTAAGPTTSSRFYIGRLKSGNLILIANNSTTRKNMTAFVSTDGGKTWPNKLLLDSRENVSYPDLDQTADGNIHVVFDRDRTGAKDILYYRFNETDVLKGQADNIYKTRVNKPSN